MGESFKVHKQRGTMGVGEVLCPSSCSMLVARISLSQVCCSGPQTRGHKWAVYVNQVAHDALERSEKARCIAAGYRWNPYLADSKKVGPSLRGDEREPMARAAAQDSYQHECGPHSPLRCEMGDLSGKLGPLSIGTGPAIYTDTNLPLVGNFSGGRSAGPRPRDRSKQQRRKRYRSVPEYA